MASTIPCTNPAHGVLSHIAGSDAANSCRRGNGRSQQTTRFPVSGIPISSIDPKYLTVGSAPESELRRRVDLLNNKFVEHAGWIASTNNDLKQGYAAERELGKRGIQYPVRDLTKDE